MRRFLLWAIYLFTLLDLSLTVIGIRMGYLEEANPILSPMLSSGNYLSTALCCLMVLTPIIVVDRLVTKTILVDKLWVDNTIMGITLIKAAVLGHHMALIQFYLATR